MEVGQILTSVFDANQGVRQGFTIIPTLVMVFISDMPGILDKDENDSAMIA